MKTKVKSLLPDGSFKEQQAGRLESTMQNIADHMIDTSPKRLEDGGAHLSTFITYNKREKTISVAKQAFEAHKSFVGTPEGSHFDMMQNYSELLAQACHFTMPLSRDEKAYLDQGPAVLIDFHPALGGLYSVIAQKLRGGEISIDSEWVMEIAEVDIAHLHLNGSLQIRADHVMGKTNSEEILVYDSAHCGKCTLINVNVQNLGVCKSAKNVFWKHRVERKESLCITLHGNGEFFAQDVNFLGDFHFEVPDGHRMIVSQDGHGISKRLEKIKECTWMWHYAFDDENRIILNK